MIKETDKFIDSNVFEGMTSISSLIKSIRNGNNDRKIHKILFDLSKVKSKSKELSFLKAVARELLFEIEMCDERTIELYSIGNTHGGIIALCGDRTIEYLSKDVIMPNGVYFMLEGVEDPYNFGNAVRSLYAAGVDAIIVSERNWFGAAGIVARSSAGTSELISVYKTEDTLATVNMFKSCGYKVICAGIRDSVDLFEADIKSPVFVIIGGEKRGISRNILDNADQVVRINYGTEFNGSLSTSASAAVFAFEIFRKNNYT